MFLFRRGLLVLLFLSVASLFVSVLVLGLPPLFDWAERSYLLERDLGRIEKQQVLRRTIDEYMAVANATLNFEKLVAGLSEIKDLVYRDGPVI